MTTDQPIDVAIIGGGPAGYAAAIYAARANLTTTVIERHVGGRSPQPMRSRTIRVSRS